MKVSLIVLLIIGFCLFTTTGAAQQYRSDPNPTCDIKANGGDSDVIVPFGEKLKNRFPRASPGSLPSQTFGLTCIRYVASLAANCRKGSFIHGSTRGILSSTA